MPTGRELISQAQQSMPSTSAQDVYKAIQSGDDVLVLDIREREEWDEGHISRAIHLARGRLEGRVEETIPDKRKRIVCH